MIIITKLTRWDSKYRNHAVTVIDNAGSMLGIMDFDKALNLASSRGFDLILVSEANPLVVKLGDFSKLQYKQKKKEKESKKNNNSPKLKEVDFGVNISQHDLQIKLKHIRQFLSDKDIVKIVIKMYRRIAQNNPQFGYDLLDKILFELSAECTVINKPKLMGNSISVTINPIKK